MTTYFTPVGALSELTLARGSQINDREDAVESGFTAIEAAIAVTDNTAGITFGTNFINGGTTYLKKSNNLVTMNLSLLKTAFAGSSTVATLPVGYRPATGTVIEFAAICYHGGAFWPAYATVADTGAVTCVPATSGASLFAFTTNDLVLASTSFFIN